MQWSILVKAIKRALYDIGILCIFLVLLGVMGGCAIGVTFFLNWLETHHGAEWSIGLLIGSIILGALWYLVWDKYQQVKMEEKYKHKDEAF